MCITFDLGNHHPKYTSKGSESENALPRKNYTIQISTNTWVSEFTTDKT